MSAGGKRKICGNINDLPGVCREKMTLEHAKSRVDKAIDVVDAALNNTGLMSEAMYAPGQFAHASRIIFVLVADCRNFAIHFEEIRRNTDRGLVNLVKVRLAQALYDMAKQVDRISLLKRITPPTKLIQGL